MQTHYTTGLYMLRTSVIGYFRINSSEMIVRNFCGWPRTSPPVRAAPGAAYNKWPVRKEKGNVK